MTYRLKDQKNNAAFYEISDKREIKPLTHYEEYMIWWKKSIDKFYGRIFVINQYSC